MRQCNLGRSSARVQFVEINQRVVITLPHHSQWQTRQTMRPSWARHSIIIVIIPLSLSFAIFKNITLQIFWISRKKRNKVFWNEGVKGRLEFFSLKINPNLGIRCCLSRVHTYGLGNYTLENLNLKAVGFFVHFSPKIRQIGFKAFTMCDSAIYV